MKPDEKVELQENEMPEEVRLNDEELEQIAGGAGAANKKTIKEYKEYIIPSGD